MARLRLIFAFALVGVVVFGEPLDVLAQRQGDSRGSTRRVSSSRSRSRSSSRSRSRSRSRDDDDDDDRSYARGGTVRRRGNTRRFYRRRRQRLRLVATQTDCAFVTGDWCYYDDWIYTGDSTLSMGFSLDGIGGVFPSSVNHLSGRRLRGGLDAGALPTAGVGARLWMVINRLRLGAMAQAGGTWPTANVQLDALGDFEAGSQPGGGWWTAYYAFAAYQPQLSPEVQLWFGARVGVHHIALGIDWDGRRYAYVDRFFFALGPEIGVMFSVDSVGLMIQAFTDVMQPGLTQLTVGFVYEEPRPPGAAF